MTREKAIDIIRCLAWHTRPDEEDVEQAIKALEQEPILDKIRAEIEAEPYVSKMEVLDIIDKYKEEQEET